MSATGRELARAGVEVRLYEELNRHVPADRRKAAFCHPTASGTPVGQLLEELGVPVGEVDLVLVNGESVDLDHRVAEGDRVSAYPVFESFDVGSVTRVREHPLRRLRFAVGPGLAGLTGRLRGLGFDAVSLASLPAPEAGEVCRREQRVLLASGAEYLEGASVTRGYALREEDPNRQMAEVRCRFDLPRPPAPSRPG